jgi:glutathione S-transferase
MHYVAIVTVVALLQFFWFGWQVGVFRVHMNTLEQLVVFLPALWIFASFVSALWAAILGAVFIVGRAIYAVTYVKDPKKRSAGFALTALPELALLIGILIWAVMALVKAPAAG